MNEIESLIKQVTDDDASRSERLKAFAEIVHRYQDMAVGYAFAYLGDFQLAEDAAQEAFIEVWRSLDRLEQPGAFVAWLRRIISRCCNRMVRNQRIETVPMEQGLSVASSASTPHQDAEAQELHNRVMTAIRSLPQHERLVTTLYYIDGYTQGEIADFLEVPTGTVKSRLHSARSRLQKGLMEMVRENLEQHAPSRDDVFAERINALVQPTAMWSAQYVYGTEPVDGNDGWALMRAAAVGNIDEVRRLVENDARLVHAEHWYQMPLHFAVREGQAEVVRYLLNQGAEPEKSRAGIYSWEWLLQEARRRGYRRVREALESALAERYGYDPNFADLGRAIGDEEVEEVERVLSESPALIHASDIYGNTTLHLAASAGDISLVGYFLDHGAEIDAERADGKTPLLVALTAGPGNLLRRLAMTRTEERCHAAVAGYLIGRGARYDLTAACVLGDIRRVKALLDELPGAASRLDSANQSPLYYAATWGHEEIVKLLLECGADPNLPEKNAPRGKALFEACAMNHRSIVKLLLERGADPNAGVDSSGTCLTIIEYAYPDDCQEVQDLLRQYGARTPPFQMDREELRAALENDDPVICRDEEFVAQVYACRDLTVLQLLLERHPNAVRCLPVWGQKYPPSREGLEMMFAHGFSPNMRDWLGKTMLHVAAKNNDIEAAKVMLAHGAAVNAVEAEYRSTPLAEATKKAHSGLVRFLLERGADPNIPCEPWARPLAWALEAGHEEIAGLLRQFGATE